MGYLLIMPRINSTSLSCMFLAQAGCGRFQPINIPMINISSVLMK
jgi:hypothetical protein